MAGFSCGEKKEDSVEHHPSQIILACLEGSEAKILVDGWSGLC